MSAIQPLEPITKIDNTNSISLKRDAERRKKQRRNYNWELALEITAKIIVNGFFSFVAFTALNKLLTYHSSQQQKLAEIKFEVEVTEARVEKLKENFAGNFDPRQSKRVMQKNSHRVDPNQRPIFLMRK
jgi:cell division protein FtsB